MKHTFSRRTVEHISRSKNEPSWLADLRLSAWEAFEEMRGRRPDIGFGAMDSDSSEWSWENLNAFLEPPRSGVPSEHWPSDFHAVIEERGDEEGLIVQRDSTILSRSITKEQAKRGVLYTDLETAVRQSPERVRPYLGRLLPPNELFASLNTALWSGGSFLFVPAHVQIELPFHTCYWMTTPETAVFPRTILVAEPGSAVSLVDDYLSVDWNKPALAVGGIEIFVGDGAKVTYRQIHHWGQGVRHENRRMSSVEPGGMLQSLEISDPRPVMTLERVAELYPEVRVS